MRRVGRSFLAFLRAGVGVMLQYRGEILLWAVWGIVNPAVLYAMWSAVAAGQPGGEAAGFSRGDFAAYYIGIMIVGHVSTAWDAYELGFLVRSGQLSAKLLRPILPIWESLANNLSYKITTFPIVLPMWIVFTLLVAPDVRPAGWQIGLGIVAVILASSLNYVAGYVVALVAFWSPKLDAVGEVFFGLGMLFGGRLAPLAALPPILDAAADVLPFRWIFAFPAELLMGRIGDPSYALAGIGVQIAWLAGIIVTFRVAWTAAIKRYSAVSG